VPGRHVSAEGTAGWRPLARIRPGDRPATSHQRRRQRQRRSTSARNPHQNVVATFVLVFRGTGRLPVSCTRTINLDDILRHIDELIDQPLTVHFRQDAALIVVAQCPAHRLVIHVRFVLVQTPKPRDCLTVDQLEDTPLAIRPLDITRTILPILQQLQQELPQIGGRALARLPFHRGAALPLPWLLQLALL